MWPVAVICAEHSACAQDRAGTRSSRGRRRACGIFADAESFHVWRWQKQERSHEVASALTSDPHPPTHTHPPLALDSPRRPRKKTSSEFILPRSTLFIPAVSERAAFCDGASLSVMNSSESRALGTLNIKRGHSSLYLVIARVKPADGSVAPMHRASPSRH